jgi:hypothetical protein
VCLEVQGASHADSLPCVKCAMQIGVTVLTLHAGMDTSNAHAHTPITTDPSPSPPRPVVTWHPCPPAAGPCPVLQQQPRPHQHSGQSLHAAGRSHNPCHHQQTARHALLCRCCHSPGQETGLGPCHHRCCRGLVRCRSCCCPKTGRGPCPLCHPLCHPPGYCRRSALARVGCRCSGLCPCPCAAQTSGSNEVWPVVRLLGRR